MSKHASLPTIASTDLTEVTGGRELEVTGKGTIDIKTLSGSVEGTVKTKQSNYESCLDKVTEKPDWTVEQLKAACGAPPAN